MDTFLVKAVKDNDRVKVQNGAFAIFGLDTNAGTRYLEKLKVKEIIVPYQDKKELLKNLDFLGIRNATIYPDMERTALWMRGKKLG